MYYSVLILLSILCNPLLSYAQKMDTKLIANKSVKPNVLQEIKYRTIDITGFAHGFKDSTWLYLDEVAIGPTKKTRSVDSIIIINERFYLKDDTPSSEKHKYYVIHTKSFSDYKHFWVDSQSVTFSGVKGNFRNSLVNGSVPQQVSEAFDRLTMTLVKDIDSLKRNFGNTDSVELKKTLSLEAELIQMSARFIEKNATSVVSAYLLSIYCKTWGLKTSKELYYKLSQANKETDFGISVKKFIDLNKEIDIGCFFIDFQQKTNQGKAVRLSSLTGKYILLEFWASWCGPCRKENPNLVTVYNKYKSRGFEIFGVSIDISASDWEKAIAADNLPWLQVRDLNGGNNEAVLIYGVDGIPANFLIDPSGKIISKNLRGGELNKKLKELLGV